MVDVAGPRDPPEGPRHDAGAPGAGAPPAPTRRRRVVRWVLTGVGVLVLAVAATAAVVVVAYLLRTPPHEASMGAAARQFRATTTTRPTTRAFTLPAAGVYRASGTGVERISNPSDAQDDGPLMPVSVSYLAGGCWRWRIDYDTAHWQAYDFCPRGRRLLLVAQSDYLSWNFGVTSITNVGRYSCTPASPIVVAAPRPGQTFTLRCTGANSAVPGPSRAVGTVTIVTAAHLVVGDRSVPAIHMTRDQTITGEQHGTLDESWWFSEATGMPLASSRDYHLVTSSVIGSITYTETGTWHLDSLSPRT